MKKIIRTRIVTKTSRRLIVCHEDLAAAGENLEHAPVHCPNCGELLAVTPAALMPANPELADAVTEQAEPQDGQG